MSDEQQEPWPDPVDVSHWLASLDEGIRLTELKLAADRAHLEVCRAAKETAATAPSEDATRRLCLLMHGVVIEPAAAAAEPDAYPGIAIAERVTGTRYEGVDIEELMPSIKARRAALRAATNADQQDEDHAS
jgi:hypothetical protein